LPYVERRSKILEIKNVSGSHLRAHAAIQSFGSDGESTESPQGASQKTSSSNKYQSVGFRKNTSNSSRKAKKVKKSNQTQEDTPKNPRPSYAEKVKKNVPKMVSSLSFQPDAKMEKETSAHAKGSASAREVLS
jgi:hypothetical protein